MIERYTRPEMGRIWSEENKYRQWLEVELAASEALAADGRRAGGCRAPAAPARQLRRRAASRTSSARSSTTSSRSLRPSPRAWPRPGMPRHPRWLHYGLTSNDVVDTAQALMVHGASELILKALHELAEVLKKRAFEFKDTVQIGRTHGIHAEPITFGLKLALWYDELRATPPASRPPPRRCGSARSPAPSARSATSARKPKSGSAAASACRPAAIASQVISRDRHANYVSTLALIAATCEKIALEIRHLQRTEVREAEEPFSAGPKRLLGDAAQAEPGHLRADLRAGARGPRPTCRRPSRTSRCGTSATSPTPRWSASSCPIPPF